MMRTLLILLTLAPAAFAAETFTVLLKGHDEPIVGYLRQVSESRFFLQSDDDAQSVTYEVGRSSIVSVDGRDEIPDAARGGGQVVEYSTLETILPNGDVEYWYQQRTTARRAPLTRVTWGVLPRELAMYETLEVFDQWGNRLHHAIVKESEDLYRAVVTLEVPVGFNEDVVLNKRILLRGAAVRDGDLWTYARNTDFPEDRIFSRKVRLPAGAEFVSASHHRTPWTDVEPLTVYWRRYCPEGTSDVMRVTYRLP